MFTGLIAATCALFACGDITNPLRTPASPHRPAADVTPSGVVVVRPGDLHGWQFVDDGAGTACTDATRCLLVDGPGTPPAGTGSAELATPLASQGTALVLQGYQGTRFDHVTALAYSTYRQTDDAGNNLAIALQVNADYDLTDAATGYQGRLVFEPYQGAGGTVTTAAWQRWDARAGRWWGTRSSVPVHGVLIANPCVHATPCTWAQLLAAFPDVGVHATMGAVVLKAGSGWAGFRGNVDQLAIGVDSITTTYDFESQAASNPVPLTPPDSVPRALFNSLGTVGEIGDHPGRFIKDIIVLDFNPGTDLAARQSAVDAVHGVVVGGERYKEAPDDGTYYLRVPGGTASSLLHAAMVLQSLPQVAYAARWSLTVPDLELYRRPVDAPGSWRDWHIDPASPEPARPNWALEFIRAPMAWGCSIGSVDSRVAIVDGGMNLTQNLRANVEISASAFITSDTVALDHGTRVASVLAATGNDSAGMTGMIWHTKLTMRDRFASMSHPGQRVFPDQDDLYKNITSHIIAAGLTADVKIINISLGNNFHGPGHPQPFNPTDTADLHSVQQLKSVITDAIKRLAKSGKHPLLVIAAGNDGISAQAAGTAAAKEDFPDQVLVAGALGADGAMWSHSNRGALVDVYAPGEGVTQADKTDALVRSEAGTSFAAPLVSGTAALMLDMDPTLSSAEVVRMIRDGARTEGGIRKLDAYGALEQVGARATAPLCGNRLWKDGDNIIAERGSSTETLVTLEHRDWQSSYISAFHGGRRFDLDYGSRQFTWTPDTRQFREGSTVSNSYSSNGGAFLSYDATNHDNTAWLQAHTANADSTGFAAEAKYYSNNTGSAFATAALVSRIVLTAPFDVCAVRNHGDQACVASEHNGDWTEFEYGNAISGQRIRMAADPSDSTRGYAAVNVWHYHADHYDWGTCPAGPYGGPTGPDYGFDCLSSTRISRSAMVQVYRVDFRAGTWTPIAMDDAGSTSRVDREIEWLAVNESGTEILWGIGQTVIPGYGQQSVCTNQATEFRRLVATPGHAEGTATRVVPLPDGTVCSGEYEAGATVSPNRITTPISIKP